MQTLKYPGEEGTVAMQRRVDVSPANVTDGMRSRNLIGHVAIWWSMMGGTTATDSNGEQRTATDINGHQWTSMDIEMGINMDIN